MRKLPIICWLILAINANSFGQLEKPISRGHFFIGGVLSFNTKSIDFEYEDLLISQKLNTFEISPDFAYFAINKLAIGIQVNSIFTHEKFTMDGSSNKKSSFLFSPYLRYYFYSGFFGETAFGYGLVTYNEEMGKVLRGKISLGYSVFLNDKIALEPIISLIKYKDYSWSNDNPITKINELNFSLSLQSFF